MLQPEAQLTSSRTIESMEVRWHAAVCLHACQLLLFNALKGTLQASSVAWRPQVVDHAGGKLHVLTLSRRAVTDKASKESR